MLVPLLAFIAARGVYQLMTDVHRNAETIDQRSRRLKREAKEVSDKPLG